MADIVHRLRAPNYLEHSGESLVMDAQKTQATMDEAAGEIVRLRGTLEYIRAQAKAKHPGALSVIEVNAGVALDDGWQEAIRDMKCKLEQKTTDEIERLRKALSDVMTWIDNWSPEFVMDDEWPATEEAARAALTSPERGMTDGITNG